MKLDAICEKVLEQIPELKAVVNSTSNPDYEPNHILDKLKKSIITRYDNRDVSGISDAKEYFVKEADKELRSAIENHIRNPHNRTALEQSGINVHKTHATLLDNHDDDITVKLNDAVDAIKKNKGADVGTNIGEVSDNMVKSGEAAFTHPHIPYA